MITMSPIRGWSRRKRAASAAAVAAGVAAAATLGSWLTTDDQAAGIPIPWPVYSIESVSNGHTASLLNLPLGMPGVVQVPMPVDIDGDLLPDVTVGLNIVNVQGAIQNPPDLTDVIAPNIAIDRLVTAPILGQAAKPLRINIKLRLLDSEGGVPTDIRFGYDTGLGGSIPTNFRAVLGGLADFFNPLTATVSTTGGYLGIDPGLPDLGLGPVASAYDGPLTLIGGVKMADLDAKAELEYSPFPDAVNISYGTDDAGGQHITYAHGTFDEVDVLTDLSLQTGDTHTDVLARVDRMPRRMAVDILTTPDGAGNVEYSSESDGRAPDVGVDIAVTTPGEAPLNADVDITAMPREMSAAWDMPQDGPMHVAFDSSGQGIGAIEARIATFDGEPTTFTPFIPSRSQHLNAQGIIGGGPFDELLITGRLERLRHVEFTQADDGGFVADLDVGDGEQPLEANVELDLRADDLPKLDALATLAPLPDLATIVLDPAGDDPTADPMKVIYDSSEAVDIDLEAEIVNPEAATNAGCGDPETICATLDARNIPPHLEATIIQPPEDAEGGETLIEVDNEPRVGGAQPDIRASLVLGAIDPESPFLAAPIEATAHVQNIPPSLRIRMEQNADDNLEELEVHACDRDFSNGTCSAETADDEVGSIEFLARNFAADERPAGMPVASPLTPLYVTATARGLPDTTDLVEWEATGKFTDIARIQFTNVDDVIGVSTDVGGGHDFSALVDVQDVDLPEEVGGEDSGRTDIVGEVLLNPLPELIDLCIGNAGRELGGDPINAVTAPCESADPFGDDSLEVSPMALSLSASEGLNVEADLRIDEEFDAGDPTDDKGTAFQGVLTNVPADLTALIQSPQEGAEGPIRLLTVAPDAVNFDADVAAQFTTGGADCDDPDANGGDVSCIDAVIDNIPPFISAYADTSVPGSANVQFYACEYDFTAEDCEAGTAGQIGSVTASARIKTGSPDPLPVRESTYDQHIVMVADQEIDEDDDSPDRDLQAQVAVRNVRALSLIQTPDGFDGHTDLGDNVTPLEAVAYLDIRNDDLSDGALVDANATITPLPAQMTFSQHGPGENQETDPLVFSYDSTAAVDVVANGKVFPAPGGDECAELSTACVHVEIDDIPEHVDAVVRKVDGELDGSKRDTELSIDLSFIPDDASDPKIDVRADGVIGPSPEAPTGPPTYVDAVLLGAPRYTSVRLEGQETLVSGVDGLEVDSTAVERLRFHACQLDGDDVACVPGTEGVVDDLTVTARSFALRPTDFPPPPVFAEPLYASVTQRDGLMEATAHITDIAEAQYINRDGLTGARTVVGGNQNLGLHVDVEGLPLGEPDETFALGDFEFDDAELALKADVTVTPLPGEFDFCFREGGLTPLPLPTGLTFTQPCETLQPFGPSVDVDHSPLSIAYRAETGGSPFGLTVTADASIEGIDHETGDPADPHVFHGKVTATQLPEALDVHVLSPIEKEVATPDGVELKAEGPTRILIDAPGVTGAGPTLGLEASYLIGVDAVCKDARATVSALCFKGDLVNLPTRTEVFYDPDIDPFDPSSAETDNLIVTTSGSGDTNFENLEFSSVKPARDEDGELTGQADVLLIEGELLGIPKPLEIRGQVDLPDDPDAPPAIEFLVQDEKFIDNINVRVQNYIAPDPLANLVIPDRSVGAGGGDPDQEIHFLQRGEAFLLDAHIEDFQGAGFKETRSTSAPGVYEGMGTYTANLDFGADQDVRAFIDIQSDAVSRIIGDVLIEDMAAGIDLCFRSAYTAEQKLLTPDDPSVFCDSDAVADEEGGFQFHATPDGDDEMDIDAFIRMLSGGGSTILAARVDIEDIPEIVQGTFPSEGDDGDVEIEGIDSNGDPDGIDQIVFQIASFDLLFADTGYDTQLPYPARPQPTGLFPADPPPGSGNQHVHAVIDGSDFHARGQIGKTNGDPSSQLERIFLSPRPCPAPENNPPDYPHYPDDEGVSDYTCIRADFDTDEEDPLDLSLRVGTADGEEIHLKNAGITDIPAYIQATLASTEPYLRHLDDGDGDGDLTDGDGIGFRRPCRFASIEDDNAIDCMPALLRLDQPEADTELFGILEFGQPSDLLALDGVDPALQLADLDARPGDEWGDWGADPEGIRAKVLLLDSDSDDSRVAIRAGLRLDIPRSMTLDQIQTFSDDALVPGTIPNSNPPETASVGGQKATDIRIRYAVRDGSGNPVNNIGELSALIHDEDAGDQILVSRPCGASTNDNVSSVGSTDRALTCNGGYDRGMPIPGEFGLQLYLRQHVYEVEVDGDTNLRDETYIQADGRASGAVDVGVRMVPEGGPGTAEDGVGLLEVQLRGTPTGTVGSGANPLEPSFRLRAELLKDKSIEPPADVTFFPVVTHTDVKVNTVFADFNFTPDDNNPARRVDAMIHLRSETAVGADIAAYSTVDGNSPAEISAVGGVDIDPLDVTIESRLSFNFSVRDILHEALEGAGFFGDIIAEIFGGLADAVLDGLEAIVNAFPLIITLESGLLAEFQLDHLNRFTLRNDLLHAKLFTAGSGFARIGPVNLDMDTFSAGVNFRIHIPFPFPLDLLFDDINIVVPLLTIEYLEFLAPPIPELFDNSLINFRDCDSLDIVNPFPFGEINETEVNGGDNKNFLLYPLSDPRYQLTGVLSGFLGGPIGDFFLDLVAGPIFCAAFDPDGVFIEGLGGSHPASTASYPADQPVPGLSILPEVVDPTNDPVPPPPPQPPPPGPPAPLPVPVPPGPAYSGPTEVIDLGEEVPLCGTHTFGALTVNGNLTVATSPNPANPYGTGAACPAGQEGRLTLRANNLIVAGTIRADEIIPTNPSVSIQPDPASGISGAGHGGLGGDGSTPTGGGIYANLTDSPATFAGSPGAGPTAGNGGGAIRLIGDDQVIVTGTVSANGQEGGSDLSGICDADPDDDGSAGHGIFVYDPTPGDPGNGDEFNVPNAVDDGPGWGARPNAIAADPPGLVDPGGSFEHGGSETTSGGGSGGGIVIAATRVTLTGSSIEAIGGNGGTGHLGAGGGGAGGLVKVVAPIQTGVTAASDTSAGLPGDETELCGPVPLNPIALLDEIDPDIAEPTLAGDGEVVEVQQPFSEVLPFGQFWYPAGPGAPSPSFDAYLLGASQEGVDNGVSVVTCALTLPLSAEPNPTPANLQDRFTDDFGPGMPTSQPTISQPCGSGGSVPVHLDTTRIFDDEFEPPDPDSLVTLTPPPTSQYLGIYSVAFRPTTANNNCFLAGDAGGVDDATDCFVEPLPVGVDAVVGIDADRPTISITSPAGGVLPLGQDTVDLDLSAADTPSGIRYLECRTTPDTDYTPCNASTPSFQLELEGFNTIDVRSYDIAGNVSTVASVVVKVDKTAPMATASISAPDGDNGWHQTPPTITISGHTEAGNPAVTPYAYRFDNGGEQTCAVLVCNIPASEINELLPGGHTFHFTAIDDAGNRLHDDDDPSTESPMQRPDPQGDEFDFKIDPDPPLLDLAFSPPDDQLIGFTEWYDIRPFAVAGAVDQVGASGINRITHDFPDDDQGPIEVDDVSIDLDDGNGFQLFNPFNPPRLGDGVHNVCARAFDDAGNQADECETVRVDSSAPDSMLSVVPAPDGDNGWYVTVPTLNAGSYDDHGGVGTPTQELRYRVDNDQYSYCNDPCVISSGGLDTGLHKVHLAGRDRFENIDGEQTIDLKVDLDDPRTTVLVTPEPPSGSNDWQLKRPYVRLFAFDQDAGSGVDHITYTIDGGAPQTYTGPFRIERGEHELCVSAVDRAGNTETEQCGDVLVDLDEPTVTINAPAVNGGAGWYVSAISATATAADAAGDSGVNPAFDPDLSDLCSHLSNADPAPSGTCVSLDGRPFVPYLGGPLDVREGVHTVRAYAVDEAGRRGPITTQEIKVDLSAPTTTHRFTPPDPARGPWYRTVPDARLESIDGDQNSGVASVEYQLGANPFGPYVGPFTIGQGITTLDYRATDNAGNLGNAGAPEQVRVDLTPPVTRATTPTPAVLIQIKLLNALLPGLLGPQQAQLGWSINENLSGTVKVAVIIHDFLGNVVRRLDGGTVNVTPGVTLNGSTTWDGKDHTILQLVPVGIYYYRVVATDEAGNVAHSGESRPIQLRLAVCLPLLGCL